MGATLDKPACFIGADKCYRLERAATNHANEQRTAEAETSALHAATGACLSSNDS